MIKRSLLLRAIALFTLIAFLSQQCLFAQTPQPIQKDEGGYTPVITPAEYEARQKSEPAEILFPESDDQFLKEDHPLHPVEKNPRAYQSVDEVSDLLREDFAYAAVVDRFTEKDIETLLASEVEVGLAVIDGEIVLFTSGSRDEIRTRETAADLFEEASLIAHFHPLAGQEHGPSSKDIEEADGEEYVVTGAGVYVYDRTGVIGRISFTEFLDRISQDAGRRTQDVRDRLNRFIADTDALNQARVAGTLFRAGGTISPNLSLDASAIVELPGKPDPILTGGSLGESKLLQAGAETASIHYDVTVSAFSGLTLKYDDFGTLPFESADLRNARFVFGIASDADQIKFEIEDTGGHRDTLLLINVTAGERIFEIDPALISSTVDLSQVRFMNFVADFARITNGNLQGTLTVHAKGLKPAFQNKSPLVNLNSYSDLIGNPAREKTAGSSPNTSINKLNSQQVDLAYDVELANTYSGLSLNFDSPSTQQVESFNLSLDPKMALGLLGDAEKVRIEIEDVNGKRVNLSAEGISATEESHYLIDFSVLAGELDLTQVRFINFVVDQNMVGQGLRRGTLNIRYGTFVPDTTAPEVILTSSRFTNQAGYTLEYTVDGVAQSETLTLAEGENTLHREFTDLSGNTTAVDFRVTLDQTAPVLVMTSPALTNQVNYTLEYTVDGVGVQRVVPLQEGANTLTITEQDAAGNVTTAAFDVTLDTILPVLVFTSPTLTNQSDYTLEYTLDGAARGANFQLAEGMNTLAITEQDAAGNSVTAVHTVTLDTVAPTVDLVSAALVNDPTYALEYQADGVLRQETLTLAEGANVITRTERDLAGNETTATFVVTLDITPPQIAFRSPALTNDPNYQLEYFSDGVLRTQAAALVEGENVIPVIEQDLAGNETRVDFRVNLDTIPPQIVFTSAVLTNQTFYTLTYTVDGAAKAELRQLAEGENTFTRTFTDPAGNSSAETLRVTLDTVPPQVVLVSAALTNQTNYTLTYTNDGAIEQEPLVLVEGLNLISRIFRDPAGNETQTDFLITLDTIAPEVIVNSPALVNDPNYTLSYTSDGVALSQAVALVEGENLIPIVEQDPAGNETQFDFKVVLDTVPPQIAFQSPPLTNNPSYELIYDVDGVTKQIPFTLNEGDNTLNVLERDLAGNETRASLDVKLDTIPPQIAFTSGALTNDPNYLLSYTVDGVTKSLAHTLVEGTNSITVTERDAAANETQATFNVVLDTVPPQIAFTSATLVNDPNYTLEYTADRVVTQRVVPLQEGENIIPVTERDAAGNETAVDFTVTLDTIPPQIAFTSAALTNNPSYTLDYTADSVQQTQNVSLTEGDNVLPVVEQDAAGNETRTFYLVTLDTVPPQITLTSAVLVNDPNYTLEYTADGVGVRRGVPLQEGENNIPVIERDLAGNETRTAFTVTLDTVPPQIALTSPVLVNNPVYTLAYTVDGALQQENVLLGIEGDNLFQRVSMDAAGNITVSDFKVTLDTVPPDVVLTSPALVKDAAYTLSYTVDGQVKQEGLTLIEGENLIVRTETDLAGNAATKTFRVVLDTIPPQVILKSQTLTNQPNYVLEFTVDGVPAQEIVALQEGANSLLRTFTDPAGNSIDVTFQITLDTKSPTVALLSPALVNQLLYLLEFTVDGTLIQEQVPLIEGLNVIHRDGQDTAGNMWSADFQVTLDTIPPSLVLTSPTLTNDPNYMLEYTVDSIGARQAVPLQEGENNIPVVERDAAGNETQVTFKVTLDTIPPQIIFLSPALTNDPNYTLEYTSDGVVTQRAVPLQEGENNIPVIERDLAGNEARAFFTVTLDTIPPSLVVRSPLLVNRADYVLEYTVDGVLKSVAQPLVEGSNSITIVERDLAMNETQSTINVVLDTVPPQIVFTSPALVNDPNYQLVYTAEGKQKAESVTLASEGENTFTRTEQDAAGNSTTASFTVTLDTVPPQIAFTSPVLVNDPNYTLEYTVDGAAVQQAALLAEGDNVLPIVERDAAGNETRTSFTVTLDTVPPQIVLASAVLVNNPNYTLEYSVDGAGARQAVPLQEGDNFLDVVERDAAGNETQVTFKVTLDTLPPQIIFTSPALTNSLNYTLEYTADGAAVRRGVFLQEGDNIIPVIEQDAAGNETRTSFTVTLDTVPPSLVVRSSFLVNRADYVLEYTVDGVLKSQPHTLIEGVNPITIVEQDLAMNETRSTINVVLDTVPPSLAIRSPLLVNRADYVLEYMVDGVLKSQPHTLIEGVNPITIVEQDLAMNETRSTINVVLDTVAPLIQIVSPTRVVDEAADVAYTLEYSVDGQITQESVALNQGPNLFTRQARDPAGNIRIVTFTVLLEAPPPPEPLPTPVFLSVFSVPALEPEVELAIVKEESAPEIVPAPGIKITFEDSKPVSILLRDGSLLTELVISPEGGLQSYQRTLPFGVVQTIVNGMLRTQVNIDGSTYELDEFGSVVRIRRPDGSLITVIKTDAAGRVIHYWLETVQGQKLEIEEDRLIRRVEPDGTVKIYDRDGTLIRIEKTNGEIWTDLGFGIDGALVQLTRQLIDGTHLIGDEMNTDRQVDPYGRLRIFDPHTNFLIQILPDETREEFLGSRKLREITPDGTLMEYGPRGNLQRVVLPDGSEIRYLADGRIFVRSSDFSRFIPATEVATTNSFSLLLPNGIRAAYADDAVSELTFPGGLKVLSPQFSGEGELTGGLLIYPTGIKETIVNSATLRRELPDGLKLDFAPDGRLVRLIKPAGEEIVVRYNKLSQEENLSIELESKDGTWQLDDEGKIISGDEEAFANLLGLSVLALIRRSLEDAEINLTDGTRIQMKGGALEGIELPDGTELAGMEIDDTGRLQEGRRRLPDGTVQYFENGEIVRMTTGDGAEYVRASEPNTFRLVSRTLSDGSIAYFSDAGLDRVESADGFVVRATDVNPAERTRDGNFLIAQNGFAYVYDPSGKLTEITQADRKFRVRDGRISHLEFGKSVIAFDGEGGLDAISLANGEKYRFNHGNLFRVLTRAGNEIIYQGSKISSFVDQSGKKVRLYRSFNTRTQTEEVSVSEAVGEPSHKLGLIPYLLRDLDRRKETLTMSTPLADLMDVTSAMGAFYTPPDEAVESFATDPERGQVSRLDFNGSSSWMGLYAKTPNVDISKYEYVSIGLKGTPGPVKIELKGTGQVFELELRDEWQDFVIPVKGRSGEITEITVLVNEPDPEASGTRAGSVLLDHIAFFTPKLDEKPDWQKEIGVTADELSALYEGASQIPVARLPVLPTNALEELASLPTVLKYDESGKLSDLKFLGAPPKPQPAEITEQKITTRYEYDSRGELKSASVDYQGQPIGTFEYRQEEGTTIVEGDDGIARRYDKDGVLVGVINPDGTEYAMNYQDGNLKSVNLKAHYLDGATRRYADGKLSAAEFEDGTHISDLVFTEDGDVSGGSLETAEGERYAFRNGYPAEVIYPSGTVRPFDVPDYEVIGWQPALRSLGEGGSDLFVVKRGGNFLKYDESGNLRQLVTESGENLFIAPGQERAVVRYHEPRQIGGQKIPTKEIMHFESAGEGVTFRLGEEVLYQNEKDFILMVIEPQTGKVLDQVKFDLSKEGEAMQMALFLRTVPGDAFLVGSSGGKSVAAGDLELHLIRSGLEAFGLTGFQAGTSWAFIGRKGARAGSGLEAVGPAFELASHSETRGSLKIEEGRLIPGTLGFDQEFLGDRAMRADLVSDGMIPLATLSNGLVTAYQKNFDWTDPESGFFRLSPQVASRDDWNDPDFVDRMAENALNLVATREEVYVYFDGRYPSNWISEEGAIRFKSVLAGRGIRVVDADQLAELMESNPQAAVIMSQDIAPDTILNPASNHFLVKDFLEAGGTMVWMHDIPFYYVGHAGINQKTLVGGSMQAAILGVRGGLNSQGLASQSVFEKKELAGEILAHALNIPIPVKPLQLWSRFERTLVANPLDSRTAVLTRMDDQGKTSYLKRADGSEVFYEDGKIRKVVSAEGKVDLEYVYDSDGNITRIYLNKENEKIPGIIDEERRAIEKRRDGMLLLLPDQEAYLIRKIDEEVAKQDAILAAKVSELESQRFKTFTQVTRTWWGGKKKKTITVEVPGVASAISEVQQARVKLREEGEKAKEDVRQKIAESKETILSQSQKAIEALPEREKELRRGLLIEEMSPVIAQTYRDLVGRDPTKEEILAVVDATVIPAEAGIQGLRDQLLNSSERRARLERREQIVAAVETMLAGREHNLTETEITNILAWLRTKSLHFGDSAYGPLYEMLSGQVSMEQLAAEVIVEDIVAGVINPTTEGELKLSLFALNKVAHLHGLETSAQKLGFDQLTTYNLPLITFVNGNHYVLVRSIENGQVTYFDQSIGEHGSEITIPLEDFKQIYSGVILSEVRSTNDEVRELSESEARAVKGSFFFLIPVIIGAIGAIASAAAAAAGAVAAAIGSVMAGIGSAISGFVSSIGSMLSGLTTLNFSSFGAGLASVGKIAGAVSLASFGGQLAAQAFGWDGVANVLGIVSQISGVISFAAAGIGAIHNVFKNGFQAGLQTIGNSIKNMGGKILNGISSIASTVGNIVTNVGSFFGNVLTGIGNFAGNVLGGITNGGFLEGLRSIGGGLIDGIGNTFNLIGKGIAKGVEWVGNGIDWIGDKIGNLFSGALGNSSVTAGNTAVQGLSMHSISQSIYNNLVNVAIGNAVAKTLDDLGVNPTLARLGTAFATGAMGNTSTFFSSGLKNMLLQGASEMALHLDLPPPLTTALSSITGLVTGNLFDPNATNIFQGFKDIAPKFFTDLAAGTLSFTNLDPQIASLISFPIGAISSQIVTNASSDISIFQGLGEAFKDGLVHGGISFGVSLALDKIDAPPLLEVSAARLIGGFVEGITDGTRSISDVLFGGFVNSVNSVLSGIAQDPLTFARYTQEQGLIRALETYAVGVLKQDTVESLYRAYGNIGQAIADQMAKGGEVVNLDGVSGEEIRVDANGKEVFFTFDKATGELIRIDEGDHVIEGEIRYVGGRARVWNGSETVLAQDGTIKYAEYKNGRLVQLQYFGENQSLDFYREDGGPIEFARDGSLRNGVVENVDSGIKYQIQDGKIIAREAPAFDFNFEKADDGSTRAYLIQKPGSFVDRIDPDGVIYERVVKLGLGQEDQRTQLSQRQAKELLDLLRVQPPDNPQDPDQHDNSAQFVPGTDYVRALEKYLGVSKDQILAQNPGIKDGVGFGSLGLGVGTGFGLPGGGFAVPEVSGGTVGIGLGSFLGLGTTLLKGGTKETDKDEETGGPRPEDPSFFGNLWDKLNTYINRVEKVSISSETIAKGTKVYRVWGDDAGPWGKSWTRIDPRTLPNFRDKAGLPKQNAGRFVMEGIITDTNGVVAKAADPLHGNSGGLDEVIVPNPQKQIKITRVSGVNPEY